MTDALSATLDADAPPEGLTPPLEALWWLKKGGLRLGPEWERAHAICQAREGDRAHDLVHALAHWIEGDAANADYWYRRAGSPRGEDPAEDRADDKDREWSRILAELAADSRAH